MDGLNAVKLLLAFAFVHGTNGQTATILTSASPAAAGTDVTLTCNVAGGTPTAIQWQDISIIESPETIFSGMTRFSADEKFENFNLTSLTATQSVMTIFDVEATNDDGIYRCDIPSGTDDSVDFEVEAAPTVSLSVISTLVNNEDMYEATCDAVGSKPQVTISWTLDGVAQTDGNGNTIVETNPAASPPLSNTKSVFTFPATQENYGQTLVCLTTGNQLTELNREESRDLNIHTSPANAGTTVTAEYVTDESDIRVICTAESEPSPLMRNYYIFSNGTLIHESMDSVNDFTVSNPVVGTNYTCMAGNYLGNTSISAAVPYDPTRTTTPPTAPNTTEPVVGPSSTPGTARVLSAGAIAGIAVGAIIAIAVIIVLIVVFVVKPDCIGGSGSPNTTTTHKHSTSAVGSSNGNEKEKIKPEAAPRGHSSIKHTTDNPQQAEYAMVDRRPGGRGDSTDARGNGAGQNEQPGMHYADLDLTPSAGHSDRVVPKNEDGVVVYSSILV